MCAQRPEILKHMYAFYQHLVTFQYEMKKILTGVLNM